MTWSVPLSGGHGSGDFITGDTLASKKGGCVAAAENMPGVSQQAACMGFCQVIVHDVQSSMLVILLNHVNISLSVGHPASCILHIPLVSCCLQALCCFNPLCKYAQTHEHYTSDSAMGGLVTVDIVKYTCEHLQEGILAKETNIVFGDDLATCRVRVHVARGTPHWKKSERM